VKRKRKENEAMGPNPTKKVNHKGDHRREKKDRNRDQKHDCKRH
jgi:hypothetical protein